MKATKAGKYSLEAKVVTANYDQRIKVSANEGAEIAMKMPFTEGVWQNSQPVEITLVKGENALNFADEPPQKGVAIKEFILTPLK